MKFSDMCRETISDLNALAQKEDCREEFYRAVFEFNAEINSFSHRGLETAIDRNQNVVFNNHQAALLLVILLREAKDRGIDADCVSCIKEAKRFLDKSFEILLEQGRSLFKDKLLAEELDSNWEAG